MSSSVGSRERTAVHGDADRDRTQELSTENYMTNDERPPATRGAMSTRSIADSAANRRLGLVFALFLALLLTGFLALSPSYPPRSRLFPLLVGVPTFICMVLVILSYVSDTAERVVVAFDAAFFETDADLFEAEEDELDTGGIRRALGWTLATLLAFYLFGFVVTTFGFVYAYMTVEGEHSNRESMLLAMLTTLFMYGLFVLLFEVRLEGGVVPTLILDSLGL